MAVSSYLVCERAEKCFSLKCDECKVGWCHVIVKMIQWCQGFCCGTTACQILS
jgi:hypothetical protein